MREVARKNPDKWFLSEKTVDDTTDWDWEPIVTREMIESERRDGMEEDLLQQEYFVSFEASVKGAYYADQIRQARAENRICKIAYDKALDVHTAWDIGVKDSTAIWFFQVYWQEIRFIDHYESSGEDPSHYVRVLKDKGYSYGTHYLPHDAWAHSFQTNNTTEWILKWLWLKWTRILTRSDVQLGINVARGHFKNAWFHEDNCEVWINCLASYHKDYNAKNQTFMSSPVHDWSSHSADAFRYAMLWASDFIRKNVKMSSQTKSFYNAMSWKIETGGAKFYDFINNKYNWWFEKTITDIYNK